mgnify:CR=1 FL=1
MAFVGLYYYLSIIKVMYLYRSEQDDVAIPVSRAAQVGLCLLYTSDAADERSSVDLGGRRIIKKKKNKGNTGREIVQ